MKIYRQTFSEYQQAYIKPLHLLTKPADVKYDLSLKDEAHSQLEDVIAKSRKQLTTQMVLSNFSQSDIGLVLNYIARELKHEKFEPTICVIDCAAFVEQYIGETEKNLAKLVAQAATNNWILFFDEADALFGKRTDIKDTHDRYANQEVSYLLDRLSRHNLLCILEISQKTNLERTKRLGVPILS
ncbi:ATP-binding protein [Paraglaciecola aquimarina]|uniref:ATP-binding protein n=1 Tax=Paraglaciecola algarum TaxID=3050085 RepID=A0ABS9D852_9ALTE|nr:AAA family ATPase [Paraglaciecola sp. G1-23]MCF2948203.1 ATP-binding protein [Paraglaciecola sp. G1-23]